MNQEQILKIINLIDLTSLDNSDNRESINKLITKANDGFKGTYPAAVCVYSNYSELLSLSLNRPIKSAVVAGYFPSGQASLESKQKEYELIANSAIDEVDIVINRGELIAGNIDFTASEIKMARDILSTKTLKVIIESGDLNLQQIGTASKIAINSGADFIKTSTGKGKTGATTEAAKIMCQEIKNSKKKVGFKVSGGIRSIKDVILYTEIVSQVLGKEQLNNGSFRIGASSLYNELIEEYNRK